MEGRSRERKRSKPTSVERLDREQADQRSGYSRVASQKRDTSGRGPASAAGPDVGGVGAQVEAAYMENVQIGQPTAAMGEGRRS